MWTAWNATGRFGCNWRPTAACPRIAPPTASCCWPFLDGRTREKLIESLALTRFTENTITDPGRLEEECQAIRRDDFATNDQEFHLGLIGLAVPIRDGEGHTVAGLAMHSPLPRLDIAGLRDHLPALREAAARMESALREASGEG